MKDVFILMFIGLTLLGCNAQESPELDVVEIVYREDARGSSLYCSLKEMQLEVTQSGLQSDERRVVLEGNQWNQLVTMIADLNLSSIDQLEVPSNDRASDRTGTAALIIKTNNQEFESVLFDAGNPPLELQKLVNYIIGLLEK